MKPEKLSMELRQGKGEVLDNRRTIIGLSFGSIAVNGLIMLYQTGILKHLPDLPLPLFDAEKVDASGQAYSILDMPDGALAIGSYATTLILAAMGGKNRAKQQPWLPLLMTAKVTFDVANSIKLSIDQWTKDRAFCVWCLTSSAMTFATAPLVWSETRSAWKQLTSK